jgi:hypothetical protein
VSYETHLGHWGNRRKEEYAHTLQGSLQAPLQRLASITRATSSSPMNAAGTWPRRPGRRVGQAHPHKTLH